MDTLPTDATTAYLSHVDTLQQKYNVALYLVGGFLRDHIFQHEQYDMDFVVAGDARAIAQQFRAMIGGAFVVLDEHENIYRVVKKNEHTGKLFTFDFSAMRGTSIEDDLSQRDFTINALAARVASTINMENVIDCFDGKGDISRRMIRMISPSAFEADPLRLLRAYRIATQYGCTIDAATESAIAQYAPLITRVSHERVHDELIKLFATHSFATVCAMDHSKLFEHIFSEVAILKTANDYYFHPDGLWGHSLEVLFCFEYILEHYASLFTAEQYAYLNAELLPQHACMKLICLFHDISKPACMSIENDRVHFLHHDTTGSRLVERIMKRLRFSNHDTLFAKHAVAHHMDGGNLAKLATITPRACYRFFRRVGTASAAVLVFTLADSLATIRGRNNVSYKNGISHEEFKEENFARCLSSLQTIVQWKVDSDKAAATQPMVSGIDVMQTCGIPEGPVVGLILDAVREAIGAGTVRNKRDAMIFVRGYFRLLPVHVTCTRTNNVIAQRVRIARSMFAKMKGLLGRKALGEHEGLLIVGAQQIHTWFMRFAIDLVFLDKTKKVIAVHHAVKPFRITRWYHRARYVLELPAHRAQTTDIQLGDTIEWEYK